MSAMKLRPKLLLAVVGVMTISLLLLVALLEADHLGRVADRRRGEMVLLQLLLRGAEDEAALRSVLESAAHAGWVREWALGPDAGSALGAAGTRLDFRTPAGEGAAVLAPLPSSLYPEGIGGVLLGLALATVLVGTILYLMLSRLVLGPVRSMAMAAHRLAGGGSVPEIAAARRPDEIGRLAAAFNSMAREVRASRAELEARVRAATDEAEARSRQLAFADRLAATGRLAAGVAHEVNSPLGGALNAVQRLRKGDLPPERAEEYLALVADALERIRRIVRQILDFGRRAPTVRSVDVRDPLGKALALVRHRLEAQGVALAEEAPEALPKVMADPGELQQVFLNLVVNALDAMPGGGRLGVRIRAEGPGVVVAVADSGPGLDARALSASFDFFYTTKPAGEGTGLGLSIAHMLVTRYGGALRLESTPGAGVTAVVELPAGPGTAEETGADTPGG
jgi:two-component system NtrC family sensor kinase